MKAIFITIAAALCIVAIIFMILNNLLKNENHVKKGWLNVIAGGIGFLVFGVAFLIDDISILKEYGWSTFIKSYYALRSPIFALVFLIAGLSIGITYLVKGYKAHMQWGTGYKGLWNSKETHTKKPMASKSEYEDFLVLVYQREEMIYLQTTNPLSLVKISFSHQKFSGDLIAGLNQKLGVIMKSDDTEGSITLMGTVTDDTHLKHYECYLIRPLNDPNGLKAINPRDLSNYDMVPLDREITLRVLMRENFDIHK